MAYDENLADRIRKALAGRKGVTEKNMFGGLSFMLGGNMCCGVVREDLVVRVSPGSYEDALAEPHARPMDFTGRPPPGDGVRRARRVSRRRGARGLGQARRRLRGVLATEITLPAAMGDS